MKSLRLISGLLLCCWLYPAVASATPVLIDFESLNAGSIRYDSVAQPNGWTGMTGTPIRSNLIEGVGASDFQGGSQSWWISNQHTSGSFTDLPFTSPGIPTPAGITPSGAGANALEISLFFKPVSSTPDGSMVEIDLGSFTGNDRDSILYLEYAAGGVQLRGATLTEENTMSPFETYVSGLSGDQWYQLKIGVHFADLSGSISYSLNGMNLGGCCTLDRWRSLYKPAPITVDGLLFRVPLSSAAVCPTCSGSPAGFYFDNISLDSYTLNGSIEECPEPSTIGLAGAGLLFAWWRLRRQKLS